MSFGRKKAPPSAPQPTELPRQLTKRGMKTYTYLFSAIKNRNPQTRAPAFQIIPSTPFQIRRTTRKANVVSVSSRSVERIIYPTFNTRRSSYACTPFFLRAGFARHRNQPVRHLVQKRKTQYRACAFNQIRVVQKNEKNKTYRTTF